MQKLQLVAGDPGHQLLFGRRSLLAHLIKLLEEPLEPRRRDDEEQPPVLCPDVSEAVRRPSGYVDGGAGLSPDHLLSELELELAVDDVMELVLSVIDVQRCARLRRRENLEDGEGPAGLLAVQLDRHRVADHRQRFPLASSQRLPGQRFGQHRSSFSLRC